MDRNTINKYSYHRVECWLSFHLWMHFPNCQHLANENEYILLNSLPGGISGISFPIDVFRTGLPAVLLVTFSCISYLLGDMRENYFHMGRLCDWLCTGASLLGCLELMVASHYATVAIPLDKYLHDWSFCIFFVHATSIWGIMLIAQL